MFFLGLTSLLLTAAGTAYGIVSTIQNANRQADLQRRQAQANAQALESQAEAEKQNQLQEAMRQRKNAAIQNAQAQTQYAKAGVALEGTPAYQLAHSAAVNEMETIMFESASEQKRRNLLVDAANTRILGAQGASLTQTAGTTQAIGMGLSGLASATGMGYELSTKRNTEKTPSKGLNP